MALFSLKNVLNIESKSPQTGQMSIYEVFTVFLSMFYDTLISGLLGFRAGATGLEGFSVGGDWKLFLIRHLAINQT